MHALGGCTARLVGVVGVEGGDCERAVGGHVAHDVDGRAGGELVAHEAVAQVVDAHAGEAGLVADADPAACHEPIAEGEGVAWGGLKGFGEEGRGRVVQLDRVRAPSLQRAGGVVDQALAQVDEARVGLKCGADAQARVGDVAEHGSQLVVGVGEQRSDVLGLQQVPPFGGFLRVLPEVARKELRLAVAFLFGVLEHLPQRGQHAVAGSQLQVALAQDVLEARVLGDQHRRHQRVLPVVRQDVVAQVAFHRAGVGLGPALLHLGDDQLGGRSRDGGRKRRSGDSFELPEPLDGPPRSLFSTSSTDAFADPPVAGDGGFELPAPGSPVDERERLPVWRCEPEPSFFGLASARHSASTCSRLYHRAPPVWDGPTERNIRRTERSETPRILPTWRQLSGRSRS
ncbi:MAG: hypothetical protein OEZ06_26810 [Myxococcales bacterium]|nr:hypothetical protein [Myxococcales bacterium]